MKEVYGALSPRDTNQALLEAQIKLFLGQKLGSHCDTK